MGASDDEEAEAEPAELPAHAVRLREGFFVAKYEATVRRYEACQTEQFCFDPVVCTFVGGLGQDSNLAADRLDHPVNCLTKVQAEEFCLWRGGRLPSEAEWEWAAAGPVHHRYPWGDAPLDCDHAVYSACVPDGSGLPVGSAERGASHFGALDMVGNVAEWVQDCWHASYVGAPVDSSPWLDACGAGAPVRSNHWVAQPRYVRTAARQNMGAFLPNPVFMGVRCVRDPAPAE